MLGEIYAQCESCQARQDGENCPALDTIDRMLSEETMKSFENYEALAKILQDNGLKIVYGDSDSVYIEAF